MSEHIKCPECKISNTSDFWDDQTKGEMNIKEGSHYTSASAPKHEHDLLDTRFHCPMCNEEVEGIHLIRQD